MNNPCKELADRIVEYVDGELADDEAQAVARHLAECEECRRTAHALKRSLGLATVLWSENLGDSESATRTAFVRKSRGVRFYAIAASVLLAVSTLTLVIPQRRPQQPSLRLEDVERQAARAGMAAELLAATRLVARCEGAESIVEQQYRYILREYAGTPAAESIKAHHNLPLGGTYHD